MRVRNAEGDIVLIDMPRGCKPLIANAGELIASTLSFRKTLVTNSPMP